MSHTKADRKTNEIMKKIIATSLIWGYPDSVSTPSNKENPADMAEVRTVSSRNQPILLYALVMFPLFHK